MIPPIMFKNGVESCLKSGKVILALAIVIFAASGCGTQTLQPGDSLVPPAAAGSSNEVRGSSSSLNNFSNISPLAKPSSDMVYTMLDKTGTPISIFADNKYLYLLRSGKDKSDAVNVADSRYGNMIDIYDVENGSAVRKISGKEIGSCTAFTVKDSNIYTYDIKTGSISLFSSSGSFLSVYDTGLSGVNAVKLAVADNRCFVLKINESGGNTRIAVYDPDMQKVSRFGALQLYASTCDTSSEISDFCLYGEKSILVDLSFGGLGLFDIEKDTSLKSCIFPMSAGFMEFDGNVLYYASDDPVSLTPDNTANFLNIKSRRQIGRLLINNEFDWPASDEELEEWLLKGLPTPAAAENGRHYGMAHNTKYLFFLDLIPMSQDIKSSGTDFIIYRVMK